MSSTACPWRRKHASGRSRRWWWTGACTRTWAGGAILWRLAILIAVVAGVMAGLTVIGASFGIGALMNVSIFPMVIMSNVIENFATSQAEFGTREAVRLTINTLGLAAVCYLAIDTTGLQS